MNEQLEYFGTSLNDYGHFRWKLHDDHMENWHLDLKGIPFNPEELMKGLPKYKLMMITICRTLDSVTVEADTPEQAMEKYTENPGSYDLNEGEILEQDYEEGSLRAIGTWINDEKDPRFSQLDPFDKPIFHKT